MSNFCISKCVSCGNLLSNKYELYVLCNKNLIKDSGTNTHINNIGFDSSRNENVNLLLNILKINKMCCRRHILTTMTFSDLENMPIN